MPNLPTTQDIRKKISVLIAFIGYFSTSKCVFNEIALPERTIILFAYGTSLLQNGAAQ
jgi:hypothetical protein